MKAQLMKVSIPPWQFTHEKWPWKQDLLQPCLGLNSPMKWPWKWDLLQPRFAGRIAHEEWMIGERDLIQPRLAGWIAHEEWIIVNSVPKVCCQLYLITVIDHNKKKSLEMNSSHDFYPQIFLILCTWDDNLSVNMLPWRVLNTLMTPSCMNIFN